MKRLVLLVLLVILPFVSATVSYHNHSIVKNYESGEKIRGVVNMSFTNELLDGMFTTNNEGTITARLWFERQGFKNGTQYTCSPADCTKRYGVGTAVSSVALSEGESKEVGIVITSTSLKDVLSVITGVGGSSGSSCFNQLSVSVLGTTLINSKHTTVPCFDKNYGCFNTSSSTQLAPFGAGTEFCEKIVLPSGPAYMLGSKIAVSQAGTKELTMNLRSVIPSGAPLQNCTIAALGTVGTTDISCVVEYPSTQGEYLVCIQSEDTSYSVAYETTPGVCGSADKGAHFERDFEIYAQPMRYAPPTFELNYTSIAELNKSVQTYLKNIHGTSCGTGCIIPITITSHAPAQTIQFSSVEVNYTAQDDFRSKSTALHELSSLPATFSSGQLVLNFSHANFYASSGAASFKLFFDQREVFETPISVTGGSIPASSGAFSITPRLSLIGVTTLFSIVSNLSINKSTWDFDDDVIETVSGKNITHRYADEGSYSVLVSILLANGTNQNRTFVVLVGDPQRSAEQLLAQYKKRVINVTSQIRTFPSWVQQSLESSLDLARLSTGLATIERQLNASTTDEHYTAVIESLMELDVPISVSTTKTGRLPISVGFSGVDITLAEELSDSPIGERDEDEVKAGVARWMDEYYKVDLILEEVSQYGDEGFEPILTKYKVQITSKKEFSESHYLFLSYPFADISFVKPYSEREVGDGEGAAIPLNGGVPDIEFIVLDSVSLSELGAFISPSFDKLVVVSGDERPITPGKTKEKFIFNWGKFMLWFGISVVVLFVIYIALQEWYKRYYEKYLFKNPDDLFNILTFIYNARMGGLKDDEIRRKLSASGWKGEQLSFAFNKISGRRTGMFEIPIFKSMEQKRLQQELERRRGSPIDTRFIKRPSL